MVRRLQPDQQADRPRRHLPADRQPVGHRLLDTPQQVPPRLGLPVALRQRQRQRPPRRLDHRAHELELAVGVGIEVRDQLDHAVPGVRHPRGDRHQLVHPRPQRRRRVAARGPMVQRPRRREPDRAVTHRLGGDAAHGRRVLLRCILQAGGPFPHHVEAQRAVGELRAQVDVVGPALHRVEVFAEALPRPIDALVQHRAGDVLDALHQRNQLVVRVGPHRREADATVAHDHRGDAVPARRSDARVPRGLAVVVRVDVDEPRRDEQPVRVDLLASPPGDRPHRRDRRAVDGDVRGHRFAAPAVGQVAAPDHQVVCHASHATPFVPPHHTFHR